MIRSSDIQSARAFPCASRGRNALRNGFHRRGNLRQRFAVPKPFADSVIATPLAIAGQNQVARAAQSIESTWFTAHRLPKPNELCQRSSDQRRLCIAAQSKSITDSRRDGEHIFQCAAQFDGDNVLAGVNAKSWTPQNALQTRSAIQRLTTNDVAVGSVSRLRPRDSGRITQRLYSQERAAKNLAHPHPGAVFDSLVQLNNRACVPLNHLRSRMAISRKAVDGVARTTRSAPTQSPSSEVTQTD